MTKPLPGQCGFAFLPPEQAIIIKGDKLRCMGPYCKRKDHEGVVLPLNEFSKAVKGKVGICKTCTAEEKMLKRYGVSPKDYETQLRKQHRICAICKNPLTENHPLLIDFNCKTNEMKGLLCEMCDRLWRQFEWIVDHPEWIEAAMIYRGEDI